MGIHTLIRQQTQLAKTYAEDGAFYSAARVLEELAAKLKSHAEATAFPMAGLRARVDIIENFRIDVVAGLHFTWEGEDLAAPVDHYLAVATHPSPTKDALSMQLLAGELKRDRGGLTGTLELTAEGRLLVRRFRHRLAGFAKIGAPA